jgi:hypothetical protein
MTKIICLKCNAINPSLSSTCHACQAPLNEMSLLYSSSDSTTVIEGGVLTGPPNDTSHVTEKFYKANDVFQTDPNHLVFNRAVFPEDPIKECLNALEERVSKMEKELEELKASRQT